MIASRGESVGGAGSLRTEEVSGTLEDGKQLFIQTCKSCHTLAAVDAHGVTGPNLDELGGLDKQRVLHAIKIGGTGDGRMPPGCSQGAGRQTPWPPTWRRSPVAVARPACNLRCILPASTGLFRPGHRSAASMAASDRSRSSARENGAWGNQMAGRPGANRRESA